jgi:hypothetical protein
MAKVERGGISGRHGMWSYTASQLEVWADQLDAQARNENSADDPKWLKRWANRIRRLSVKKERAHEHKLRQK